jgi:hypothetical protein
MPGFFKPVPNAVHAIDWRVKYHVTPEVEAAAARRGMPPIPVFEVVDAREGHAWAELAKLKGLLPETTSDEAQPCLDEPPLAT